MPAVLKKVIVTTTTTRPPITRTISIKKSNRVVASSARPNILASLFLRAFVVYILPIVMFTLDITLQTFSFLYTFQVLPFLQLSKWTPAREVDESTHPELVCQASEMTATTLEPLIVHNTTQGVNTMLLHGVGFFTNLLGSSTISNNTSISELRDFILWRNQHIDALDNIPVIAHTKRWSFGLDATEHPSIGIMLEELTSNTLLRNVLEQIVGPDPALVELSSITAAAGAGPQYFHQDTKSSNSATRNAQTFVPMYSLLIPLQDTYAPMGPTAVCPGSHKCSHMPTCRALGYPPLAVSNNNSASSLPYWNAGDGLLYNSQTQHRGSAHVQGPHRVALVLTFASRPDFLDTPRHYSRSLPIGAVWALRWNMWGYTWSTMTDMVASGDTASILSRQTNLPGWSFVRVLAHRLVNDAFGYRFMDLEAFLKYVPWFQRIPSFLQGRVEDDGQPFVTYFSDLMNNLRVLTLALSGLSVLMCITFQIQGPDENKVSSLHRSLCALLMTYASIAGIGAVVYSSIASSEWGQGIQDIAKQPLLQYPNSNQCAALLQHADDQFVVPHIQDMLVGSRLLHNSHLLAPAQHRVLQFHPGNQRWSQAAQQRAELFLWDYRGLPTIFRQHLVRSCQNAATSNNQYWFLLETQFGDWVRMTEDEAWRRTQLLMVSLELFESNATTQKMFYACQGLRLCPTHHPVFEHLFSVDRIDGGTTLGDSENKPTHQFSISSMSLSITLHGRCKEKLRGTSPAAPANSQKDVVFLPLLDNQVLVEAREPHSRKWKLATKQRQHTPDDDVTLIQFLSGEIVKKDAVTRTAVRVQLVPPCIISWVPRSRSQAIHCPFSSVSGTHRRIIVAR